VSRRGCCAIRWNYFTPLASKRAARSYMGLRCGYAFLYAFPFDASPIAAILPSIIKCSAGKQIIKRTDSSRIPGKLRICSDHKISSSRSRDLSSNGLEFYRASSNMRKIRVLTRFDVRLKEADFDRIRKPDAFIRFIFARLRWSEWKRAFYPRPRQTEREHAQAIHAR